MPRRNRRRIVGRWEQVEREAREDELKELERELHREWEEDAGRKRKRRRAEPDTPEAEAPYGDGNEEPPAQP